MVLCLSFCIVHLSLKLTEAMDLLVEVLFSSVLVGGLTEPGFSCHIEIVDLVVIHLWFFCDLLNTLAFIVFIVPSEDWWEKLLKRFMLSCRK